VREKTLSSINRLKKKKISEICVSLKYSENIYPWLSSTMKCCAMKRNREASGFSDERHIVL